MVRREVEPGQELSGDKQDKQDKQVNYTQSSM